MTRRANRAREVTVDRRKARSRGSSSQRIAIFPGSFDPLTHGHSDIIRRALDIFDRVIVAVLLNSQKNTLFSIEERLTLIRSEFEDLGSRIEVTSFSGLLVDFAKTVKSKVIVRGLRAVSDYDYEAQMALMNKSLWGDVETIFLVTREEYSYISSTLVKQVATMGGDVSRFVSPRVARALRKKIASQKNLVISR